jgi:hypothetical protein
MNPNIIYPGATFWNPKALYLTIEGFAKPAPPNHTAQRHMEPGLATSCEYCALLIHCAGLIIGDCPYNPHIGVNSALQSMENQP